MFDKLKTFIFFVFIVSLFYSCQNKRGVAGTGFDDAPKEQAVTEMEFDNPPKERVVTEAEFNNPPKELIDMSKMMEVIDSVLPLEYYTNLNWAETRAELSDEKRKNKKVFEDIIWKDPNTLTEQSVISEKKLLFHNGYFIVKEDGNAIMWRFLAYGQYVVDREGRIVCSILNRYCLEPSDSLEEYYKTFLENDTITFTIKHNPELYYHQWQLASAPGDEVFYGAEDQYTNPDMIYNNDGVELYKYEGGIKRCTSRVNLREKPSLDAKIIAVLDSGRHIQVEARTTAREKIDNKEDYWYYFYYAVDNKYIPVYGYVFGGYLEDAADPEEINLSDMLSQIDVRNITETDIEAMRERLIGNSTIGTSSKSIQHKKYVKPGYFKKVSIGSFSRYSNGKNEYVSIFAFERLLGYKDTKAVHAIDNIIVYPHKTMNLYCQQVLVWSGSYEEDEDFTIFGLYKYPRDGFIGFEVTYYPQEVIIIDNRTGEMRLSPNENNKYSFFTGL